MFLSLCLFGLAAVGLWKTLRRRLLANTTINLDIPLLGQPRTTKISGTAVVCGGSIAGLLTARACQDHFTNVIIVEPEAWVNTPEAKALRIEPSSRNRSRIMQYDSLHVAMRLLYLGLQRLFPDFDGECAASGIGICPADMKTHFWGKPYKVPYASDGSLPRMISGSRKALETLLRRLTLGKDQLGLTQIIGTVVGLDMAADGSVGGVQVRMPDGGAIESIPASLVIDCTGPTIAGRKWLQRAVGVDINQHKASFDAKMCYTTTCFVVPPTLAARLPIPGGWNNVDGMQYAMSPDPIGGGRDYFIINKTESNQVFICCGGWADERVIHTIEDIKAYVREVPVETPVPEWVMTFLDMLKEIEGESTYSYVRVPPSYNIHYEDAKGLPSNYIAIGDSVSRVNPIYGQGCSKALIGVAVLDTVLHQRKTLSGDFAHVFFATQAKKTKAVWESMKSMDYGRDTTIPIEGESIEVGAGPRRLRRRLMRLALTDEQAGELVWRSGMMVDITMMDFFHPLLLVKLLWQGTTGYEVPKVLGRLLSELASW